MLCFISRARDQGVLTRAIRYAALGIQSAPGASLRAHVLPYTAH